MLKTGFALLLLATSVGLAIPDCKTPATYSCLAVESTSGQQRCFDYFSTPSGNKPCGGNLLMPNGCPKENQVASCQFQFLGNDSVFHSYAPYTLEQTLADCRRLKGFECVASRN